MKYAGIGSRETPLEALKDMTKIATILDAKGYTLRSGGAKGADSAFEAGSTKKEIFYARDCTNEALQTMSPFCTEFPLERMKPYIRDLIGRNSFQILGGSLSDPVDFVICWTKNSDPCHPESGGTRYACRLAKAKGIPIYNMKN